MAAALIFQLLEQYPGIFRPLYDRICTMCRNTQEMMRMFSEELSILDKNTVMMMIEEQQEAIDQMTQELSRAREKISRKDKELSQKDMEIEKLRRMLEEVRQEKKTS